MAKQETVQGTENDYNDKVDRKQKKELLAKSLRGSIYNRRISSTPDSFSAEPIPQTEVKTKKKYIRKLLRVLERSRKKWPEILLNGGSIKF